MGRIKELYIDLQNEYGQNLEDAPIGFSIDEYLKQKAEDLSIEGDDDI